MEYARRRNRRRRHRSGGSEGGGAGRAIIALLMVGAIVYLISSSSAGEWIAQKVIAPVIEVFSGEKKAEGTDNIQTENPDFETPVNTSEVSLSTEKNAVSAEVTLPAVTSYMLQMGSFSTEENALAQATLLKTMGGGGYVMLDEGRYRVLAAGYTTKESAEEVRDRLKNDGVDCMVHPFTTASASFRVTAAEDRIEGVKSAFQALADAQSALSTTSMRYDATTGDVDEGKAACLEIASKLKTGMEVLSGYADSDSEVLKRLLACYDTYESQLNALAQSNADSLVAFSAQIKYTQLYLTHEYFKLMEAFSSVA
ncbi:MAG TPA: SPOR domain-containing protein [Clostridia bacterium]|nr:SPOR domain-containing protein [Clostridia bacterium]